jgi:hypothetical protein
LGRFEPCCFEIGPKINVEDFGSGITEVYVFNIISQNSVHDKLTIVTTEGVGMVQWWHHSSERLQCYFQAAK